jgi:hypothetical protein
MFAQLSCHAVHPDHLFLDTLTDLDNRVQKPRSEYEAVMTAPLLRKLLRDSPSLVDAVNRERRLKIRYVVDGRLPIWMELGEPPPYAYAEEDGFDPDTSLIQPVPMEVTRDLLLSRLIMVYRGQEITVKNLVRYVAHVAGGVHLYAPKNEQEAAVQSLANEMRIGGKAAGTRTLLAVGRVV